MKFIQAQGANHLPKDRLAKLVNKIIEEQMKTGNVPMTRLMEYKNIVINEYGLPSDIDINSFNTYSYCIEEKYDGYSYINAGGRFYSKRLSTAKGNVGSPVDKTDNIPHLARLLKYAYEQCGCDLHGELYSIGGTSDDVTKIMGCTPDKAQKRQEDAVKKRGADGVLHYMLIDIRAIYGKSLINEPHRIRRAILKWVYETYIEPYDVSRFIRLTQEFNSQDPRITFMNIVRNGGEGIIIKDEDALYIPGKKPMNNWIKGKKSITHDVFMVGLTNGTGKNDKLFGAIEFAHMVDGKQVTCGRCSSGLSDEMREHIYNNASQFIENKQVFEIEAIQESVKSFRNPVFLRLRNDKDWSECDAIDMRVKEDLV